MSLIVAQLYNHPTVGHFGIKKTVERVKQRFYWAQCRSDVQMWCARCSLCSSKKGPIPHRKAPLGKYVIGASMERVAIDVMGPFVLSDRGNRYLLVAMDYFSKWPEASHYPAKIQRRLRRYL